MVPARLTSGDAGLLRERGLELTHVRLQQLTHWEGGGGGGEEEEEEVEEEEDEMMEG